MSCATVATASDINYCSDKTTLHIGVAMDGYDWNGVQMSVLFTELATGTITRFDVETDNLPFMDIEIDGFAPTPGHTYRVNLVGVASTGTSAAARLRPWFYDTTAEGLDIVPKASAVDQVLVKFVKQRDQVGTIVSATEQWLII